MKYFYGRILLISFIFFSFTEEESFSSQETFDFSINTRLSFYSFENRGEFLIDIPETLLNKSIVITVKTEHDTLAVWKGRTYDKIFRLPFPLGKTPSVYKTEATIYNTYNPGIIYRSGTDLIILDYKPNEVKTDRLTGGLIVNKRPFIPFGFYCYSPVHTTMPEEEVVKGFNMISPYQKIEPETLSERMAYMNRCAEIGMKVHYNLLSVSGGGGVGSSIQGLDKSVKKNRLIEEILTFRDHPALLAWYISDEPNGNNISAEELEEIYKTVKNYDPWHPVSIVFMAPFISSKQYVNALDIVMADPYPVPDIPVTMVGNITNQLTSAFEGKRPVWIVPQAFGGGEWWSREPTLHEIRSMTYQAIINGARGIQYFVRQGLNLFPKSTATWGECGRMAVEIAEITPWLLSEEETIPVTSYSRKISVTSEFHNGQLLIIAVNKVNNPEKADFKISTPIYDKAKVLFENRSVQVKNGYFSDYLTALGTQVYLIDVEHREDPVKILNDNLIKDPGFEDATSPGVPSACYAWSWNDRGATYFLDTREHIEGNHSVRLITPSENNSARLKFFPVPVNNGSTYIISVWAKCDPEMRPTTGMTNVKPQYFEITAGEFGAKSFTLSSEWHKFVTSVTIPYYSEVKKTNIILQMPSTGTAWFDMLQVTEGVNINRCINPENILEW